VHTLTKINIDMLSLRELKQVQEAYHLLTDFGIDHDRLQTRDYIDERIKQLKEKEMKHD